MEAYKNVLVVIDEQNFVTKAISRAINLVKQTHGQMSILLLQNTSEINHFSNLFTNKKQPTSNSFKNKSVRLRCIIKELSKKGVNVSKDLLSCVSYKSILNQVKSKDIDTVIVAASPANFSFGYHHSVDSFLIGQCPTALLIVKDHKWAPGGHILSAVEIFNDNPEHQLLTKKVLEESEHFSQLLNGDCHTVDCYYGENIDMYFNCEHCEKNQDVHLSKMKQHCHDYHLSDENIHLSIELPENAISNLSSEVDSELIILGDCGHRGLLSTLSTHVSEEVLNKVNCDVLVLKP